MQINNTPFISAKIPLEFLDELDESPSGGQHHPGFVLIDNHLVSHFFLEDLFMQLSGTSLNYESVQHVKDIFEDQDYWESLTDKEREMIGPCLIMLISNGYLGDSQS